MADRNVSSSEQYVKKSNRIFLFLGLVVVLLFLLAYCAFSGGQSQGQFSDTPIDPTSDPDPVIMGEIGESVDFNTGNGTLTAEPSEVSLSGVVLGSQAESIVILKADGSPVLLKELTLAEEQQDGFTLGGTCQVNTEIKRDSSCTLKVMWNPVSLRQIQNTLAIRWRENDNAVFDDKILNIRITGQSTDSKDCVICENKCNDKEAERSREAALFNGRTGIVDENGKVKIGDQEYLVEGERLIDPKTKETVGMVEPEKIPLGLDNAVLGTISKTQDVLSPDGKALGRLLGDDTIVDSNLKVLGAAVPLISVMDMQGKVIGVLEKDGTVLDGTKAVIGRVLVNGAVADLEGKQIGYVRPYGLVAGFTGNIIGGVISDGRVVNSDSQAIGTVKPSGVVVNSDGEMIGAVILKGVAVGPSCKALGAVLMNGQVKDSFNQIVGNALLDGSVVDEMGHELGSVVRQGLVISEKGSVLGFVNSAGKAVDVKGSVIGCVNPDGSVAAGSKTLGGIMPKGFVVGQGCQAIGSVYPNGVVMNGSVEVIGQVGMDSYVVNMNNKIVGVVVPRGSAIADGCRLLGLLSPDGQVMDQAGLNIGCMTIEKKVINKQGDEIGFIAPKGAVVDKTGQVIGRVRLDGKVMDLTGKVIGCVNQDGTVVSLDGKTEIGFVVDETGTVGQGSPKGVVLDENGNPKGWTVVGNEVFDESGKKVGIVQPNGWVTNDKSEIIAFIPPDGVIVSHEGLILGRYTQKTGVALTLAGERFGVVLPDYSVLDGAKEKVIGLLIPDKTPFLDMDDKYLGTMNIDGLLQSPTGETLGVIKSDGTVVNKAGQIVGVRMPQGRVLSAIGEEVGTVNAKGEVISSAQSVIGHILGNGIAVSNEGQIMGGIFPEISLPMSGEGVMGAITLQGKVNDSRGRSLGRFSPFGTVIGDKDAVAGKLVRIGPYVDLNGKLLGWTNFKGELVDKVGNTIGSTTMAGLAVDAQGSVIGSLVPHGPVIAINGNYLGSVATNGQVATPAGQNVGVMSGSRFLTLDKEGIVGQLLVPGIGVDAKGNLIGWTKVDGSISNAKDTVGRIGLSGRVLMSNGQVLGTYIPLGTSAIGLKSTLLGIVSGEGKLVNRNGDKVGAITNDNFVVQSGKIVGRLMQNSVTANDNLTGQLVAVGGLNGQMMVLNDSKTYGSVMVNGLVTDLTKKVVAGLSPNGLAVGTKLNVFGKGMASGQIVVNGKVVGNGLGTGNGAVSNAKGEFLGGLFPAGLFIGRDGAVIGQSSGTAVVLDKNGKKVANYMAFGSALTQNAWAGGVMPMGLVVNDDGYDIGVVALDGAVIGKDDAVMARILSDGTAVGVSDRNLYTTMPYAGHIVKQGLPFGYKNIVLGRTTAGGDIIDAMDKKVYRELDDGTILGTDMPLEGAVLSFNPATGHDGEVLGVLTGDGLVKSISGEEIGQIAVNGAVKGNHKYRILGAIIPEPLVVNDCKVIGQTSFNGQVVNGNGQVMGRINPDKWALDMSNNKIGRVVRIGFVAAPNGDYIGRTMPDSTVVDLNGVNLGCAKNDGSVVNGSGEEIGAVVERGLVIDKDGNPTGRVKANGSVVDKTGKDVGKVLGDGKGTVVNNEGEKIGRVVPPDEEIMFTPEGKVAGTFGRTGVFKDPQGTEQFQVLPDGRIIDPRTGKQIAELTPEGKLKDMSGNEISDLRVLRDTDGNVIGLANDQREVINEDGQKIGTIDENGYIYDLNNNVIEGVSVSGGDISQFVPNQNQQNAVTSGRRIFLGDKVFDVTPNGSLVDKDGNIVGYMGPDGRPRSLDDKLLVGEGVDGEGRTVPVTNTKKTINPEQAAAMDEIISTRRAAMKKKINSFSRLLPDGRTLAKARKKEDIDWGVGKIVSSYPVDMSRMILKDKAIPAVLAHSIDSRFTNVPVTAIVERHIYAESGRRIIIPAGSRLIGSAGGGSGGGSGSKHVNKMEISWTRLIRPDGSAFLLSATSGDAQGRGGVAAYLDEQLLKKYGKPVLSSTLTSAIAFLTATNDDMIEKENGDQVVNSKTQAAQDARSNFIDSMSQIFTQLLEESTEYEDVVFVPAGTRLTVFANEDLWLRSEIEDEQDYNAKFGVDGKSIKGSSKGNWEEARKPELEEKASEMGVGAASVGTEDYGTEDYYEPELEDESEALYDGSEDMGMEQPVLQQASQFPSKKKSGEMTDPVFPRQQTGKKLF